MAETATQRRPLDEVMLAMDVVDTLRHRQMLVQRELHADDRERKLIERLREIYASQGIDVPDTVLAEGVAALAEERFVYKPPEGGIAVTLARLYVARVQWFKRLGIVAATLAVLWLGYHLLIVRPEQQQLKQEITALNTSIRTGADKLDQLEQDASRLETALSAAAPDVDAAFAASAAARREQATQALHEARDSIGSAREMAQQPDLQAETFQARSDQVRSRLASQGALIARASAAIGHGQTALAALTALTSMPASLTAQRDAVLTVAAVDAARRQAKQLHEDAVAALRSGDVDAAKSASMALRDLRQQLESVYELRIVSRPGEYSGVWRIPERSPDARNYYVIVEAVTPTGEVLTVPVTSEEDGQLSRVSKWGLRVSERIFRRIAADKDDDGIVQNQRFGIKERGHLEPEYLIETTGAAITTW